MLSPIAQQAEPQPELSLSADQWQAPRLIKEIRMFTRNNHFWMIGLTAFGVLMSFAVAVAAYAS